MRTKLFILSAFLVAVAVWSQEALVYNPTTTMHTVGTNSTLIYTVPSDVAGANRIHLYLYENRGTTDVVFAWKGAVPTTNIVVNATTTTVYVGHLLRPLDSYEGPADKECDAALSAVSTNTDTEGVLAVTRGFHQP